MSPLPGRCQQPPKLRHWLSARTLGARPALHKSPAAAGEPNNGYGKTHGCIHPPFAIQSIRCQTWRVWASMSVIGSLRREDVPGTVVLIRSFRGTLRVVIPRGRASRCKRFIRHGLTWCPTRLIAASLYLRSSQRQLALWAVQRWFCPLQTIHGSHPKPPRFQWD
jgi:hypothetical protein